MNYAASAQSESTAKLPGWRATLLFGLLLAGLAGLFGRGVYLQGIHDDFLQEKGKARYSRVIEVNAHFVAARIPPLLSCRRGIGPDRGVYRAG
jgi:cell division protein FtsI (penicillin-binding protein 3)